MKNLVILGSTGSVGTQTIEVANHLSSKWNILALTANNNINLLYKQARKYIPRYVVIMDNKLASDLKQLVKDLKTEVLVGKEGLNYVAGLSDTDLVVNCLVGAAGLKPSISALKAKNKLALANKESLVIGGEIINDLLQKSDQEILPLDSEHNALFTILRNHNLKDVNKLILTASGGPFLDFTADELKQVTVKKALNHPNWNMGKKITIDSATLMNKGLEVIEAHWLFQQPYDKIKVVIHPESIIHSLVEFIDTSLMAELGVADMRIPIQNVLTYPEIEKAISKHLDLFQLGQLNFSAPDYTKFSALNLAYQAGEAGGSMPIVLNAANEIAVNSFLEKEISFIQIPEIIEKVLNKHNKISSFTLSDIFEIDNWAREKSREVKEVL